MKSRVEKSRGAEEITHCCLYFVVVVVAVAFSRGKFLPQIILTLPLKLPHRPVRCYWYLMLCLLVCFLFSSLQCEAVSWKNARKNWRKSGGKRSR